MRKVILSAAFAALAVSPNMVSAQLASPSGALPAGVSVIGGVVADLVGTNGNRLVSQLAASQLYEGFANANPLTIGTQTGFTAGNLMLLGGGLSRASFRFTLYDGDTGFGNFDRNDNTMLVNGQDLGNWGDISTNETTSNGTIIGSATTGFLNERLHTGWFTTTNVAALTGIWTSLNSTNSLVYQLNDVDPFDNYFDFKLGIESSLITVGSGPAVAPPVNQVPEPASLSLLLAGGAAIAVSARRRRKV
jgi:hypothetical protein